MPVLRIVFTALIAACSLAAPASGKVLYHWVELGEGDAATARAITDGGCPDVRFDGSPVPMTVRAAQARRFANVPSAAFPVTACERRIPSATKTATIGGDMLNLPHADIRRIIVFGDTGCRIAKRERVQACNDPTAWPFPEITRRAAATHPDLVIHVGDYLYREEPCPAGNSECAGTPYGFGWDTWDVDFFRPADPLLRAAPWVLVRGNHEDCNRAAEGWFRFFDRAPMEEVCRDLSGIFVSRVGNFGIVNVDAATVADGMKNSKEAVQTLQRQFESVRQSIPDEAWLISHRPFDAVRPDNGVNSVENHLQSEALGGLIPPGVRMLIAGHIHFFQAVDFGGKAPPQLVVGTGGDNLAPIPPMSLAGSQINGKPVSSASAYSGFAYMVWDRAGDGWTGTLFGFDGSALDNCRLTARSLICNH
jgi:hypothetical protein